MIEANVPENAAPTNRPILHLVPAPSTVSSEQTRLFNTLMSDVAESGHMTGMTREEMTARLELVEAKADARLARFEERIDQAISEMRRESSDLKQEFKEERTDRRSEMRNLKLTIVTTGIAAVVGLWAANISMVQTMLASFESGKSSATALTQATEQIKQTQEQLQAIQDSMAKRAKSK
jgi:hypothetical protein